MQQIEYWKHVNTDLIHHYIYSCIAGSCSKTFPDFSSGDQISSGDLYIGHYIGHITASCSYQHTSLAITLHVLWGPNRAFMFPQLHVSFLGYFTLTSNAREVD